MNVERDRCKERDIERERERESERKRELHYLSTSSLPPLSSILIYERNRSVIGCFASQNKISFHFPSSDSHFSSLSPTLIPYELLCPSAGWSVGLS